MTILRTVRVAAIQATPVILDAEATAAKAVRLLEEAADAGAELAVLPEVFFSLYPSNSWAHHAARFGGCDELWERMWMSSVDVPGPIVDQLAAVCHARSLHVVVGVNERESERPGTLYNTMLTVGPEGLLHRHRKLMPTQQERLFHGIGRGDDLRTVDTTCGRIGGLICWENRMPMARYAIYRQGPQIWVAPTADDSDGWIAHMRAIAIESGAFVVSVPQYIPRSAFPDDFPLPLPDQPVLGNGGAAIIGPSGKIVAGPLYGEEGMLLHDCDLKLGLHAKRTFDAVGHYSRDDVLPGGFPMAGGARRGRHPADRELMRAQAAGLGARYVDALAARDHEALAGVLHPEIDFRGLTPNRAWEATGTDAVLEIVLGTWFDAGSRMDALDLAEHDAFADREQLRFRFSGHNADGAFVVEQQAYLTEREGRIGWMRVVCSGFRSSG